MHGEVLDPSMRDLCFTENRATLHLHGGVTPWISDGTPHQWITPADEATPWPQGVAVGNVPDMAPVPGVPDCTAADDGCQTFYYTNQQSARLMFYHDHAWGITRLNVYAGEAAGYVLTDATEQNLIAPGGALADVGLGTPLVIQDRTFVPTAAQLAGQDPTWDSSKWGGMGDLWYHHVYMPAQNPGDPSGMSAYGRWMYGPWFWPPATPVERPDRQPVLQHGPERGAAVQRSRSQRPATSTTRRRGSTRSTRSASRNSSPARRTSASAWSSSTTRRSSTAWPTRPRRSTRRPIASAS